MMTDMTLQQVATSLAGKLAFGDCHFTRVSTDTRQLQAGDLFFALRGPRFDAHQFLQQAADGKACGLVVEQADPNVKLPQLIVADTTLALGQLAKLNRNLFKGPVVAVTGSGGKTTVKTLLRNIFAQCGNVYATKGNLNNHLGVPLSLLELGPEHDYAVIEMGASGPGEIAYLVELTNPDVGLVNNALRAHVEGFGSLEGVARAKGEMFAGLRADGTAIINMDDSLIDIWLGQVGSRPRIAFSAAAKPADLVAADIGEGQDGRPHFELHTPVGQCSISLQLIGRHNVANALAAAACAYAVGVGVTAIKAGLEASEAVAGRMQRKAGVNGSTIIDDSYNANPDSAKAAVDSLAHWPGRKILVLGQMAELGSEAEQFHKDLGAYAKTAGLDMLIAVGGLARQCSEAFGDDAHYFDESDQAADFLRSLLDGNTVALIKGSRSAHMEQVVTALTEGGDY